MSPGVFALTDVTEKGKRDKSMAEISENLGTDTANKLQEIIGEMQRGQKSPYRDPMQQQFIEEVNCLLNSVRQQQLSSQSQLQASLNQAASNLTDSNRFDTILDSVKELLQAAQLGISNLQINMKQYKSIIDKMERDCHQQQVTTDLQVVQALQQAISSMAQAQNSLLQSQAVDKMYDSITKCQDKLAQIEALQSTKTTM
jgi:Zn-dependent M32 family carboxypeptidase